MYAKVAGKWQKVYPPAGAPAVTYNDATGGTVTEYDQVLTRTKIDGQQFTTDLGGYTLSNQNGTGVVENGVLMMTKTGTVDQAFAVMREFPVAGGDTVTVSADVIAFPAGGHGTIQMVAIDSAGAQISGGGGTVSLAGKEGSRASLTRTLAAGATKVRVRLVIGANSPTGTVLKLDNLLLEKGDVPDATWFDGATASLATGKRFRVHTFTADGTLTVTKTGKPWRTLVVGGGGAGGNGNVWPENTSGERGASGGGAGFHAADDNASLAIGDIAVKVGAGGAQASGDSKPGGDGGQSALGAVTADGGQGGAQFRTPTTGPLFTSDITGTVTTYADDNSNSPAYGSGGTGGMHYNSKPGTQGVVIVSYEIEPPPPPIYNDATGGTITEFVSTGQAGTVTGKKYRVHSFGPGPASFVVTASVAPFTYLLTGGGGGGAEGGAQPQPGMPGGGADVSKGEVTLAVGTYDGTIGAGAPSTQSGFGSGGESSTWNGITVAGGPAANPVSGHNGANAGADPITGDATLQYGVQGGYKAYANVPGAGNGGGGGRTPGEWGFGGSPGALIVRYEVAP